MEANVNHEQISLWSLQNLLFELPPKMHIKVVSLTTVKCYLFFVLKNPSTISRDQEISTEDLINL